MAIFPAVREATDHLLPDVVHQGVALAMSLCKLLGTIRNLFQGVLLQLKRLLLCQVVDSASALADADMRRAASTPLAYPQRTRSGSVPVPTIDNPQSSSSWGA